MDPYSDYKPNQTKTPNPKPNQSKSPKDGRDGSSTEEAVSSPGRDYKERVELEAEKYSMNHKK